MAKNSIKLAIDGRRGFVDKSLSTVACASVEAAGNQDKQQQNKQYEKNPWYWFLDRVGRRFRNGGYRCNGHHYGGGRCLRGYRNVVRDNRHVLRRLPSRQAGEVGRAKVTPHDGALHLRGAVFLSMKKLLLLLGLLVVNSTMAADIAVTFINNGAGTAYNVQAYWRNAASPIGTTPLATPSTGDMSSGETDTGTGAGMGNVGFTIYIWVAWYTNSGAQGNINYSGPTTMPSGTAVTLTFEAGGSIPPAPTHYNGRFCVKNNDTVIHTYQLYSSTDGAWIGNSLLTVSPGETKCKNVSLPDGVSTNGYVYYQQDCQLVQNSDGSWTMGSCVTNGPPISGNWSESDEPLPDYPTAYEDNPTDIPWSPSTNNPSILYSSTNSDDRAVQALEVLYNETASFHRDNNNNLNYLKASSDAIKTAVTTLNTTAGTIKTSVDAVKTSVDTVNTTAGTIKTSVDSVKTSVDAVNTTLQGQNNSSGQVATNTAAILTKQGQIAANTSNLVNTAGSSLDALRGMSNSQSYANLRLDGIYANGTEANTRLTSINSELTGTHDTLREVRTGMNRATNELGGIKTTLDSIRTNIDDGVKSGIRRFHIDNTNLLGQILEKFNGEGADGSWTNLHSDFTTESGATSRGNSATASVRGSIDSMAGAVSGVDLGDGGTELDVTINLGADGTYPMRIRPLAGPFAGVFGLMKRICEMLLAFGFALKVTKDLQGVWRNMVATRGVTAVQLDFTVLGTGGNAAGALLMPVIVVAVLAVWATALAVGFTQLTGALNWGTLMSSATGNPLAGMDSGAKHLLLASFPVAMAFGLLSAYLTFRLTLFKVEIGAQAAAKFLVGA